MKPTKSILILLSLFMMFSCGFEPDYNPPTITITWEPINIEIIHEEFFILINTHDEEGNLDRVEVFINDSLVHTENNIQIQYEYEWNTDNYEDGEYSFHVICYDKSDNYTISEKYFFIIDNTSSYPNSVELLPIIFSINNS